MLRQRIRSVCDMGSWKRRKLSSLSVRGVCQVRRGGLGIDPRIVKSRFDDLLLTVMDSDRYACWLLFAVFAWALHNRDRRQELVRAASA